MLLHQQHMGTQDRPKVQRQKQQPTTASLFPQDSSSSLRGISRPSTVSFILKEGGNFEKGRKGTKVKLRTHNITKLFANDKNVSGKYVQ